MTNGNQLPTAHLQAAPLQAGHKPLMQRIQGCTPNQMIAIPEVVQKFTHLVQTFQGVDKVKASIIYEQEKFNFLKIIADSPKIAACDPLSIYGCFLDAAVNGLSFDPTKKHLYLVPYGNKVKLEVSPYGELLQRMRAGQIRHADNPVLIYEGDHFKLTMKDGLTSVEYEMTLPRTTDNIVGCFLTITRPDGSLDYKVLSMPEVLKLKALSKSPTSVSWTTGISGMIMAKTIKHAFKTYPKVPVRGQFSQLASEKIEEISYEEMTPQVIDYGFDDNSNNDSQPPVQAQQPPVQQQQPPIQPPIQPQFNNNSFAQQETPVPAGVVYVDDSTF